MRNYPAEFYAKDKKPLHQIGYSVFLAMMAVGVLETLHGVYYQVKQGDGNLILGPALFVAGGGTAYLWLKEAGVVY